MTLTPEEALREAIKPYPMTAAYSIVQIIDHLASLGYALHPIKIDEAAVEKAARAVCNAQSERSKLYDNGDLIKDRWDFIGGKDSENGRYWLFNAREAITVYHEALVRTR